MDKIKFKLKSASYILGTAAVSHYVGTIMGSEAEKAKAAQLAVNTENIKKIAENTSVIKERVTVANDLLNESIGLLLRINRSQNPNPTVETVKIPQASIDNLEWKSRWVYDQTKAIQDSIEQDKYCTVDEFGSKIYEITRCVSDIQKELQKYISGSGSGSDSESNFLPNLNFDAPLQSWYSYLDSLTLLQESAVVHMLFFLVLILTIFSIFSILFWEEVIKYLKLEERFPKIAKLLKIRAKIQRFYLFMNLIMLLIVCLVGFGLNLFVFFILKSLNNYNYNNYKLIWKKIIKIS